MKGYSTFVDEKTETVQLKSSTLLSRVAYAALFAGFVACAVLVYGIATTRTSSSPTPVWQWALDARQGETT